MIVSHMIHTSAMVMTRMAMRVKTLASHPHTCRRDQHSLSIFRGTLGRHRMQYRSISVHAGTDGGLEAMIQTKNSDNPVMVYSKTYCPFCSEVKSMFAKMDVAAKVVELDTLADGDDVQAALQGVSGMRTVPQVFVGGTLVGGCDDTLSAYKNGNLMEMLDAVGVTYKK